MKLKGSRRLARQFAFQTLYAMEFNVGDTEVQVPETDEFNTMDKGYAIGLINCVRANATQLDATIQQFLVKKNVERMDKVNLTILRMAMAEISLLPETLDPSIAINEAINLGKAYGNDRAYKLINAVLDAYVKSK